MTIKTFTDRTTMQAPTEIQNKKPENSFILRFIKSVLHINNISDSVRTADTTQATIHPDPTLTKPAYDAIAFSGGGAKGFAFAGVIQQLGDRLEGIKEVAGASAGAMTAMMVALGMKSEQIVEEFSGQEPAFKQEVLANSLQAIVQRALLPHKEQIAETLREHEKQAEYKRIDETVHETGTTEEIKNYGEKLKRDADASRDSKYASDDWLKNITFEQLDIIRERYPELGIKKLYLTASLYEKKGNMTSEVLLSAATTPHMPIYQAALASSALPGLLPTVDIKNKDFFGGAVYGPENSNKTVHLRDGGVHNNLPHQYLTGSKKLVLNFTENQGIHLRKLTFFEKIKNIIAGEPVYNRRQSDTAISEEYNQYNHYVNPHIAAAGAKVRRKDKISTTDINKAKKHLDRVIQNAATDFAAFEAQSSQQAEKKPATPDEISYALNKLKYKK